MVGLRVVAGHLAVAAVVAGSPAAEVHQVAAVLQVAGKGKVL